VTAFLRATLVVLALELANLARVEAGAFVPDPAIALAAAIALQGRDREVIPAVLGLALLRVPTTLASPFAGVGALLAFGLLARSWRHLVYREKPAVTAAAGAAAALSVVALSALADGARGVEGRPLEGALPFALATGALAALCVPALRSLGLTRRLMDRRLGEPA
jgi:hypothetical protein